MSKKAPNMPTPKNLAAVEADWPPVGGQPIQVGPETNWALLALKYGYTNPWDIIRFNFKTSNPDEVNYYMGAKLFCNLVTKDGKNFRFGQKVGDTVRKVTIYLPQLDWEPDPGPARYPDRPMTDDADDELSSQVWWLLTDPRINRISFLIGGHHIGPKLFDTVRGLIMSRAIAVYKQTGGKEMAEYDDGTNSLHIRPGDPTDPNWSATVLHEVVHAGLDHLKARNIRVLESESAAYIAQCWYYIARLGFNGKEVQGSTPAGTAVLQAAYSVASELHLGRGFKPDYYTYLQAKIMAHPEYTNWASWCIYDGVWECS